MSNFKIHRRFARSSALDLRRKVLLKNFLRTHKILTDAVEETDLKEPKQENIPSADELCNTEVKVESEAQEVPIKDVTVKREVPADVMSDTDSLLRDDNSVQTRTYSEHALLEGDIDSFVLPKSKVKSNFRRKLRRRFSVKRKRSNSENSVKLGESSASECNTPTNISSKKCNIKDLKNDVSQTCHSVVYEAEETSHLTTLDKTDVKSNICHKVRRRFSLKRPHSFNKEEKRLLQPSENTCNATAQPVTTTVKSPQKRKKCTFKSCFEQMISKECNTNNIPSVNKKSEQYLCKFFQSKNSCSVENIKVQSEGTISTSSKDVCCNKQIRTYHSVAVQTDLSCFPKRSVSIDLLISIQNKPLKNDVNNSLSANESSYWLRSSIHKSENDCMVLRSSNVLSDKSSDKERIHQPVNKYLCVSEVSGKAHSSKRSFYGNKLTRSSSVQEDRFQRKNVCRRVKSVYISSTEANKRLHLGQEHVFDYEDSENYMTAQACGI